VHVNDSGYRNSHQHKGIDYHTRFSENPRRAMVWNLERKILLRIVSRFLDARSCEHLDFACGTGRILTFLEDHVATSTGVDISESMLAIARQNTTKATIFHGDLTREPVLKGRSFDLITTFRFFPNAEPQLRTDAINTLTRLMKPDGLLVFNNHRNTSWLRCRLAALRRKKGMRLEGMSDEEVRALVAQADLTIKKVYHVGVLPETETQFLRPRFLASWFESVASRLPLASLSEDLIYVCSKRRRLPKSVNRNTLR